MIRNVEVPKDTTDGGEEAEPIVVQEEDGTFYISQSSSQLLRINMVGMSREQAKLVRDALNRLLEPIF